MAFRTTLTRKVLPTLLGCILATAIAIGAGAVFTPHWKPIYPALAESGSGKGGSSGGKGSSGSGGGESGGDNSGHGSSSSGPGSGGDDGDQGDNSGPGGGDDGPDDGDDDGHDDGAPSPGSGGDRSGRGGRDYVSGEVVVANVNDAARGQLRQLGFVVLEERRFGSLGFTITRLGVPPGMTVPLARSVLASRFPGLLADANALYRPQAQLTLPAPDYPQRLVGWGRPPHGCGAGLRLGMLDSMVDLRLPALREGRIVQRSFLTGDAQAAGTAHGTAIAAILLGQGPPGSEGLLPGAELSVAGVFARDDAGAPVAEVLALVDGLNWLIDRRVPVINLSFAGDANALVSLALQRAAAARAVLIAAAGNNGPGAAPSFPAAEEAVIGVTAVDSHRRPYKDANQGDYVDFAAPGVRVWTPTSDGAGSYSSGTSFATPYVAAAFAAQMARVPGADAPRLAEVLARTALDLGAPRKDPVFGWGLIQSVNPCVAPTQ